MAGRLTLYAPTGCGELLSAAVRLLKRIARELSLMAVGPIIREGGCICLCYEDDSLAVYVHISDPHRDVNFDKAEVIVKLMASSSNRDCPT